MADIVDIEISYIPTLSRSNIAYKDVIGVVVKESGEPVDFTVQEAVLSISTNERSKLILTLGNGLTWNDEIKALTVIILNEQMSFVREDTQFDYHISVSWSSNQLMTTLRKGTVTAVRES